MVEQFDDAVVGAGIVGLAHAYHLALRGRKVLVLERHGRARGASVRNFGMIWPIGQPAGPMRNLALRSRTHWLDVLDRAGIWHDRVGSLHLAYEADEAQVLAEFADQARSSGFDCELLNGAEAVRRSPRLRRAGLRVALWSPHEICIDPRGAVAALPDWLASTLGVRFEFDASVTWCEPPWVHAGARRWSASRAWVCGGDDLATLFPDTLQGQQLVRCKLQMMRSQPVALRIGPMLAAGLTLLHYRSFDSCPMRAALQSRIDAELPEYRRYGIHVMVSQNGAGELVIGDSHEYDDDIEPFDKARIDTLVLQYLDRFFDLPTRCMAAHWHGCYVKHPTRPYVAATPATGVVAVTGLGGHGMTMSFGVAEDIVRSTLD